MAPIDTIKTVVLLLMENRSFDHLLGHLSLLGPAPRRDVDGLRGRITSDNQIKNLRYANPANGLVYWPYFLDHDERFGTDMPHSPELIAAQLAASKVSRRFAMNGFARAYYEESPGDRTSRCPVMSVYPPHLLPVTNFLAQNFAICDRWFSAIPTDTHPNRLMALSGYTRIAQTRARTLPEQDLVIDWIADRGLRWRVYSEGLSFIHLMRPSLLLDREHFRSTSRMANDFLREPDSTFPEFILVEPAYRDNPFVAHPNDNHPPLPMAPGEMFVRRIYEAVTANPERFRHTLFILTYDEHGGFLDHAPPLPVVTPMASSPDYVTTGPRVPAIVVSPWVNPGAVYHGNLDHTSILRFMAERFTPGKPYSDIVEQRHCGPGELQSVAGALTRTSPRQSVPAPPPHMHLASGPSLPVPRESMTPGQRLFDDVQRKMFADHPESTDILSEFMA